MPEILIISNPLDFHTHVVSEALTRKGITPHILYTPNFPANILSSMRIDNHQDSFTIFDREELLLAEHPDTIWWRRPRKSILPDWVHPEDRDFTHLECAAFSASLWAHLNTKLSFWINPIQDSVSADHKICQLQAAKDAGLSIPATIISNNPADIKNFIRTHNEVAIYKPFKPIHASWCSEDKKAYFLYTSRVTREDLPEDEILQTTPGIFQELIEKDYELRVTIMGDHIFPIKIPSQNTKTGKLDWRSAYHELAFEPTDLPSNISNACLRVLKDLGLVFGCLDLIVTPEGEYVFLEVNESGQFLWVEGYTGLPLLDAFTELLIQGRKDFRWTPSDDSVRYEDVYRAAADRGEASMRVGIADRDAQAVSST